MFALFLLLVSKLAGNLVGQHQPNATATTQVTPRAMRINPRGVAVATAAASLPLVAAQSGINVPLPVGKAALVLRYGNRMVNSTGVKYAASGKHTRHHSHGLQ
jgi:hypothetical protein